MYLLSGWNVFGNGRKIRNDGNAMYGMRQWRLFCCGCNHLWTVYHCVYRKYLRINVVYGEDRSRVYCVHVMYKPFKRYRFCHWVFRNIRSGIMFIQLQCRILLRQFQEYTDVYAVFCRDVLGCRGNFVYELRRRNVFGCRGNFVYELRRRKVLGCRCCLLFIVYCW